MHLYIILIFVLFQTPDVIFVPEPVHARPNLYSGTSSGNHCICKLPVQRRHPKDHTIRDLMCLPDIAFRCVFLINGFHHAYDLFQIFFIAGIVQFHPDIDIPAKIYRLHHLHKLRVFFLTIVDHPFFCIQQICIIFHAYPVCDGCTDHAIIVNRSRTGGLPVEGCDFREPPHLTDLADSSNKLRNTMRFFYAQTLITNK